MLAMGSHLLVVSITPRIGNDYIAGGQEVARVAADKGTASFSDIANEVAVAYGFWLGDAFAS
ncbi:NAD-glutamate dehydrogenase domain-containing protein, partial [Streptomyces sp. NPDC048845]|uniref:NAD-glutamate dehydrogenase domain-containing protein n=1 Tax=Streptomyces sp. NPDC048845 TaxID=3155390 RepID=UPI003416FD39